MSLFPKKTFTLADNEVILSITDPLLPAKISSQYDKNIVMVSTPSTLTAGTFTGFAELTENGGFFAIPQIGAADNELDATKVGAGAPDGEVQAWSFTGSPYRIKIKQTGVTGATTVDIVVSQNVG